MESHAKSGSPSERSDPLLRKLREHRAAFEELFGESVDPIRVFFSPGRVNLMGAHLDYNGGPVMPMAIDRGTFFAVRVRGDRHVRFSSTLEPGEVEFDLDALAARKVGRWFDYPLGVVRELAPLAPGARGFDLMFGGSLPVGAGLSSSASICVGTAFVLDALWELGLDAQTRVEAALSAEREFVGVHCGIMDPYAVGFAREGKLLWLDCRDRSIAHLPLDHGAVGVAVADSGVRRELAQGAFNQRVAEANEAFRALREHTPGAIVLRDVPLEVLERRERFLRPEIARRARHVIEEVARTFVARDALLAGDVGTFGAQMFDAHRSMRELYEVSTPELDCLVDTAASTSGVLGARLTGAGFGGCVVILMRRAGSERAMATIAGSFARRFGRIPSVRFFGGDSGPRELVL